MTLVIMDFDGVIIDTEKIWYEIFYDWFLEKFNYKLSINEFLLAVGADSSVLFDYLREKENFEVNSECFIKETNQAFIDRSKDLPMLPGVSTFIKQIKNSGFSLCLATSASLKKPRYHLERLDLLKYFDFLVTSELVERIKPAPDLFLKALEIADVSADEAIIIEDSKNGLIAGVSAGIDVIICPNTITMHDDFKEAKYIVEDLNSIPMEYLYAESEKIT